jgi:hypothetical protein
MSTRFNHHIIFALSFYLVLCSPKHSRLTNQTRELGLLKPHRDRLAVVLRRSSSNFKLTAELNLVNDCQQSCIVLLLFHSCYLLCVNGRSLCWEINHISIYCCIWFSFFFLSFFRSLTMHNLCYNNLFGAPIYCYLLHFIFQNLNGTMIQSSNFIHLMFLGLNWYFDKMLGYDTPCHFFILLKTLFYSFCRMNKLF